MEKKQTIRSTMLNSASELSVVGAFELIQDAVTELMGTLGIDGKTVGEKFNAFWVFTKTRVKFLKSLVWNEPVTINVFISSVSLVRIYVDVEVKNHLGELALCSRTELCVLSKATEKIMKVSEVGASKTMVSDHPVQDLKFARLGEFEFSELEKVKVRYTNIDFCHHTNNLEYVRLIFNTYKVREMESKQIREVETIYISQSFEDDVLKICKAGLDGRDVFLIEKEGKPVVKCEVLFE